MNVIRLWWLSLGIAAAVVGVVAALLGTIAAVARSIDRHAEAIWNAGKQIAGNTVSIWMLQETNKHLEEAQGSLRSLEERVTSLDRTLRALAAAPERKG